MQGIWDELCAWLVEHHALRDRSIPSSWTTFPSFPFNLPVPWDPAQLMGVNCPQGKENCCNSWLQGVGCFIFIGTGGSHRCKVVGHCSVNINLCRQQFEFAAAPSPWRRWTAGGCWTCTSSPCVTSGWLWSAWTLWWTRSQCEHFPPQILLPSPCNSRSSVCRACF